MRMLGTFNQHLSMILSNNYPCQSKLTPLLDTGISDIKYNKNALQFLLIIAYNSIEFNSVSRCTYYLRTLHFKLGRVSLARHNIFSLHYKPLLVRIEQILTRESKNLSLFVLIYLLGQKRTHSYLKVRI